MHIILKHQKAMHPPFKRQDASDTVQKTYGLILSQFDVTPMYKLSQKLSPSSWTPSAPAEAGLTMRGYFFLSHPKSPGTPIFIRSKWTAEILSQCYYVDPDLCRYFVRAPGTCSSRSCYYSLFREQLVDARCMRFHRASKLEKFLDLHGLG